METIKPSSEDSFKYPNTDLAGFAECEVCHDFVPEKELKMVSKIVAGEFEGDFLSCRECDHLRIDREEFFLRLVTHEAGLFFVIGVTVFTVISLFIGD